MSQKTDEKRILNQQELQKLLKERGLPLTTSTIHACVEAGMPAIRLPGHKKPRFHWDSCWGWIIAPRVEDPLSTLTRDRAYHRSRRLK